MCLAIPGRIVELADQHFALVEVLGVRRRVNVDLLAEEPLEPGDWLLIHVGFAMSRIDEARAREQMRLLELLGGEEEAVREIQGYDFGRGS